jgi:DNA-binding response OmpR family regulator
MKKNNMPIPEELNRAAKNKALVVDDDPKILKMLKRMFSAGISDYISKPFKSEELIKKVKRHLLIE